MPSYPPLGSYEQFGRSAGGPFAWGEGGRSSVAYNEDVLPDLVAGLRALPGLARQGQPRKAEPTAAVLACVYVLTSSEIVDALIPLESCVIVDRQQANRRQLHRLHNEGRPLSTLHLPGFAEVGLPGPDGSGPVITPWGPMPDPVALGPVRAAGWSAGKPGDLRPLLHAKMLVAGRTWVWENHFGAEEFHFTPLRTWMGSANWSAFAPSHLEFGVWSDDPALLARNLTYLLEMVRFSQPLDSTTAGPEPELVDADWADDEEFREALRNLPPDEDD
jgi:hypothetical protein